MPVVAIEYMESYASNSSRQLCSELYFKIVSVVLFERKGGQQNFPTKVVTSFISECTRFEVIKISKLVTGACGFSPQQFFDVM